METAVSDAINHLEMQMTTMKTTIDNLSSDENNLMAKIDKKRNELDRAEKRLKSLQGVRYCFVLRLLMHISKQRHQSRIYG